MASWYLWFSAFFGRTSGAIVSTLITKSGKLTGLTIHSVPCAQARRMRVAAREKSEAAKVSVVKAAEAEAEAG